MTRALPITERQAPEHVFCIACRKQMTNIAAQFESQPGHQPDDGLVFRTGGNYGSTYFDPMDGTYLEISVCDECVEKAEAEGLVYRSEGKPGD